MPHLFRDGLQGAVDDLQRDGVDGRSGHDGRSQLPR
jgi:hypothetical protein